MKTVEFLKLVEDVVQWRDFRLEGDQVSQLMKAIADFIERFNAGLVGPEIASTDPGKTWRKQDFEDAELFIHRVLGSTFTITPSLYIGPFIRLVAKEADRLSSEDPTHHQMKLPGLEEDGFHFRNDYGPNVEDFNFSPEEPAPPGYNFGGNPEDIETVQVRCPQCQREAPASIVADQVLCPCGKLVDVEDNKIETGSVPEEHIRRVVMCKRCLRAIPEDATHCEHCKGE